MSYRGVISTPITQGIQSKLILDSKFRESTNQTSSNFSNTLSTPLKGNSISHELLAFCPGIFAHNKTNCTIKFSYAGFDYISFMPLWRSYENSKYSTLGSPEEGSYEHAVEWAFNNNARFQVSKTVVVPLSAAFPNNFIRCKFVPNKGYVIYVASTLANPDLNTFPEFIIQDCEWIENGHLVHGIGSWDDEQKKYVPAATNSGIYMSSTFPELIPFNEIAIFSYELTRYKSNTSVQGEDQPPLNNEIGVYYLDNNINTTFARIFNSGNTSTKWDLQVGNEMSNITIFIQNNRTGKIIRSGNPLLNFSQDPSIEYSVLYSLVSTELQWSSDLSNYFMFGSKNPWDLNMEIDQFVPWCVGDEDRLDNEIIHEFNVTI